MGWASGSLLMEGIIRKLPVVVPDNGQRQRVYVVLIHEMRQEDWDTEDECVGVDPAFDAALRQLDGPAREDE